jgi:hypothetical protein
VGNRIAEELGKKAVRKESNSRLRLVPFFLIQNIKNMKFNFQNKITIAFFLMVLQGLLKKEENIGSEVVNVVKPYTAAISDAFKVPETPVLDDEGNAKRNH